MTNILRRMGAAALGVLGLSGLAEAQAPALGAPGHDDGPDRASNAVCTTRIPASEMAPTAVYVAVAVPTDTAALRARPAAQRLVAQVAERIRLSFGTKSDSLAWAEPRVQWQGAAGALRVTAYRDGRLTWNEPVGDSLVTAGVRLLATTLAIVRDSGSGFEWPASVTRDSISFTIRLQTPTFSSTGALSRLRLDRVEPLFKLWQPWIEPALALSGTGGPKYPDGPKRAGAVGRVSMLAVVDSAGRIEMGTARDLWPEGEPRLTGTLAGHYAEFVESVREFLPRGKYLPARIGGCPVRSTIAQAFEFKLAR